MHKYAIMFFGVSVVILFVRTYASDVQCNRYYENQMDKGVTRLIVVGQKNLKFPANEQQLRPYCNLALKTFDMISEYNEKCLPKFGRDAAKVIMHAIKVELRGVCKTGRMSKRARELLGASSCANAGLKNFQKCNLELIEKFTGIVNAPLKMRIPMSCCNFHQLIKCLTDEAEDVKQCTRKTIDYVIKYVTKIIDPLLMILCNEYNEPSDRCDQMVRLTPKITTEQTKYKSFLLPLINIAQSLDEKIYE